MSKRTASRLGLLLALLLAAVLAALPALAQPVRAPAPSLSVRFLENVAPPARATSTVLANAATSTAYRAAAVTVAGGAGGAFGGAVAVIATGTVLLVASDASLWSASSSDAPAGVCLVAAAVGLTVGTGLAVGLFGEGESDYGGLRPYPDIRPDDGHPAVLGVLVALPVGLAAGWLIQ